ncbi:hypothetical protein F5Y18DRAFT_283978 [Xylariaceae sp. FL1019]|nr:hypothetical protein F5Y18DRAFT_283978 [Xylariaceae sp. FL1019]
MEVSLRSVSLGGVEESWGAGGGSSSSSVSSSCLRLSSDWPIDTWRRYARSLSHLRSSPGSLKSSRAVLKDAKLEQSSQQPCRLKVRPSAWPGSAPPCLWLWSIGIRCGAFVIRSHIRVDVWRLALTYRLTFGYIISYDRDDRQGADMTDNVHVRGVDKSEVHRILRQGERVRDFNGVEGDEIAKTASLANLRSNRQN